VSVDRRPARASAAAAVGAGLVAAAAAGAYSWGALGVGACALVVLGVGLGRGRAAAVTAGAGGLVVAVLVAGVRGAPVVPVVGGVAASVVAWDTGRYALGVGRQLGREADTTRVEAVHAGASVAVGLGTAAVGYGVFRTAGGGRPVVALVFTLVAAVALVAALD
jgi:hypothetical protein